MRCADRGPVLIFDLDETLLRVNSFPLWVRFLIVGRLSGLDARRRVMLSLRVMSLLVRRKLHRIGHDELLQQLQHAWRATTQGRGDAMSAAFQAELMREVRPSLLGLLRRIADGGADAVLATAAASDYASGLARRLGFQHVLATDGGGLRNSGVRKRDRVHTLLRDLDWQRRPRILFTDHLDDLPLMRTCDVVCWFGADPARADGINAIHCLHRDADDLQSAFDRAVAALDRDQAAARSDATAS